MLNAGAGRSQRCWTGASCLIILETPAGGQRDSCESGISKATADSSRTRVVRRKKRQSLPSTAACGAAPAPAAAAGPFPAPSAQAQRVQTLSCCCEILPTRYGHKRGPEPTHTPTRGQQRGQHRKTTFSLRSGRRPARGGARWVQQPSGCGSRPPAPVASSLLAWLLECALFLQYKKPQSNCIGICRGTPGASSRAAPAWLRFTSAAQPPPSQLAP